MNDEDDEDEDGSADVIKHCLIKLIFVMNIFNLCYNLQDDEDEDDE